MGYTILGHEPHGIKPQGARNEKIPAIPQELIPGNEELLLHEVKNLVITVLGRQGALSTNIDPGQFHAAIRKRYPEGHYDRAPNQEVKPLDEWHYACRVAERLLGQIEGQYLHLDGGYNSGERTQVRAAAIFKALQEIAAKRGIKIADK